MFRLFFTYILPLIAPTLLYLLWNWIQLRRAAAGKRPEPPPDLANMPWLVLAGAGISLMVVSMLAFAVTGDGGKPGAGYVPPRYEGGEIRPAETR
ncbi:MAG TPA: hypothetical protein VGC25_08040 [Alphaproteobacteria bacterium]|jgi:hypothetical protein